MRILVPREDVNDDTAVLVRWLADDGATVAVGQPLCELETSKTIFEVLSPAAGILHCRAQPGQELAVGGPLAEVGERSEPASVPAATPQTSGSLKLTREAERFVTLHNLDLSQVNSRSILTLDDVRALMPVSPPTSKVPRVILMGAGSVGLQVLDILLHDPNLQVVGLLDDAADAASRDCFGLKVIGKLADLELLYRDGMFDQAVVALGLDMQVKRASYERCKSLGIKLANAIDPSARLNRRAVIGEGNVLCSFVHVGVDAVIGNNNFLAAHTSVDHHCQIGSHTLFGPGCLLSGRVRVGDGTLFGSGVVVQPNLSIGKACRLASGTVILRDVPDAHAVRIRLPQEVGPV